MRVFDTFEQIVHRYPDKTALIYLDQQINYLQLRNLSLNAARLLSQYGIQQGDTCLICLPNSIDTASILLGLFYLGVIPVIINEQLAPTHVRIAAERTDCALAIFSSSNKHHALAKETIQISLEELYATKNQLLQRCCANSNVSTTSFKNTASILFTSGSTGTPKGVAQSHSTLINACKSVAQSLNIKPTDSILCAIPWSFDYGYGQLLSTILLGICQILPSTNDPFGICKSIEVNQPTIFAGVPSLFASLFRGVSPIQDTECSSIRLVTNTGSTLPIGIREELFRFFSTSEFSFNYGLTETYRTSTLPTSMAKQNPDSVGYAIPGVTLSVITEHGSRAKAGEIGEIVHYGTGVFQGYWGDIQATEKVLKPTPVWNNEKSNAALAVYTGDFGYLNDQGMLYLSGRRDRQLKSMGVKVNPEEIEQIMLNIPTIEDIGIISTPHEIIGDMIVAVVVPKPGVPEIIKELQRIVPTLLGPYMQPRKFFLIDKLPRTPNGKIDYQALSKQVFQSHNR